MDTKTLFGALLVAGVLGGFAINGFFMDNESLEDNILDVKVGSEAPDFTLRDSNGNSFNLSDFENEKLNIFLSLIKFILVVFKKAKIGIDLSQSYLSKGVLDINNLSNKIKLDTIDKKFDYLINNENDLFTFNLDKKIFMINFFATR